MIILKMPENYWCSWKTNKCIAPTLYLNLKTLSIIKAYKID